MNKTLGDFLIPIFLIGILLELLVLLPLENSIVHGKLSQIQSISPPLTDRSLETDVVFRGIDFPTSMAFLDEEDILVLEKNTGQVKRIVGGEMLPQPLIDVNVANQAERGLLGIAVANHINGAAYVFLYYTEAEDDDGGEAIGNRLYRFELEDDVLVRPKLLIDLPADPGPIHNGGKITIGPDENLYVTVGDIRGPNPQEAGLVDGRGGIIRITQDGHPVGSVLGEDHPVDMYYAYGIRNSFGLDFDPVTGNLWDSENGPGFGDEINLVRQGFNSGWAEVQGIWLNNGYSDLAEISQNPEAALLQFGGTSQYSNPQLSWVRSIGLTALTFLSTTELGEEYENDLLVGDFHEGNIYHFDLSEDRSELVLSGLVEDNIVDRDDDQDDIIFAEGFGGITDMQLGPDGNLYVLSLYQGGSNCSADEEDDSCISYDSELEGTVFRIRPASESQQEEDTDSE